MRQLFTVTGLALIVALAGLAPPLASAAETQGTEIDITLRAAPAGFVLPSAFVVNNEAQWIVDPLEEDTYDPAPGVAGCELSVGDRNGDGAVDGADVLDEAEEVGCIESWSARNHGTVPYVGSERSDRCSAGAIIVSEVDGLEEVWPATFWFIHRNGEPASSGICSMALEDGESLAFVYE